MFLWVALFFYYTWLLSEFYTLFFCNFTALYLNTCHETSATRKFYKCYAFQQKKLDGFYWHRAGSQIGIVPRTDRRL